MFHLMTKIIFSSQEDITHEIWRKKFRQFPTEDIGNQSNQVNHIKYDMSKFKQRRDGKSFRDEVSIDYK